MIQLVEGIAAPDFSGINQKGETISLNAFRGKKVILYFYPKDDTPGCTAESCNLNDNYDYWISKGFEVIGISPDNEASHAKFAHKYGLKRSWIGDAVRNMVSKYLSDGSTLPKRMILGSRLTTNWKQWKNF